MSQRGDSGQKKIPQPKMKDGMNAEPSWRRQAMRGTSLTMTLAQKPKKIPASNHQRAFTEHTIRRRRPATTQSCQNMTRAPRIRAGAISAEYMGTVAFFAPIPIPITNRAANRPCHDLVKPEPIGVAVRQQAVRKISPRRPK